MFLCNRHVPLCVHFVIYSAVWQPNILFAGITLKCWSLCKRVVYFQQAHCPTSNKSVAQDSMSPARAVISRLGHATDL